ncbi:MAG: hypothetical protein COA33_002260 [Fluviicola sp.]|nr:hypothetical protein [Fluviicola sp.]
MRIYSLIFLIFLCKASYAQLVVEFDTLTYSSEMNSSLDSIDISGADYPSTFDGGVAITSPYGLSVSSLFNNYTTPTFLPNTHWKKMSFSALPHLGFSYSFGGQGSQFIKARYEQAFSDSMNLNISYQKRSGIGSIRNANFSVDDFTLQFQRLGRFYSASLKGSFHGAKINHPGGVATDTLIQDFGLDFSPVNKDNANSRSRVGRIQLNNYFDFVKDTLISTGFISNHFYEIKNRIYLEEDSIATIYSSVFIDSLGTRDQFNNASIANGGGAYFLSKRFYLDALLNYTYREYQNLGQKEYISEIGFTSTARLTLKNSAIENDLRFNLVGRFNEFREYLSATYSSEKLSLGANFLYEQKAPTYFQRMYLSNTSNYQLMNATLQKWLKATGIVKYQASENVSASVFGELATIGSYYQFNGGDWNNVNATVSMASIGVKSALKLGVLNIHPRFVYSTSSNDFLPKIQASSRLFLKGKLFKDKKLEAILGVDVSYISQFSTKTYVPSMDTYDWSVFGSPFTEQTNLHAFISLGISKFRFFFRYENIGYFWADKQSQVVANYPIAGPRMRLGMTWDFFN